MSLRKCLFFILLLNIVSLIFIYLSTRIQKVKTFNKFYRQGIDSAQEQFSLYQSSLQSQDVSEQVTTMQSMPDNGQQRFSELEQIKEEFKLHQLEQSDSEKLDKVRYQEIQRHRDQEHATLELEHYPTKGLNSYADTNQHKHVIISQTESKQLEQQPLNARNNYDDRTKQEGLTQQGAASLQSWEKHRQGLNQELYPLEQQNEQHGKLLQRQHKDSTGSSMLQDNRDSQKLDSQQTQEARYLHFFETIKYKYRFCKHVTRPNMSDIPVINNRWQYFMLNRTRTNMVAVYYDTRSPISGPSLQGFAALVCPLGEPLQAKDYRAMVWYEGFVNPLSVKCWTKNQVFGFNWWNTDNMTHGTTPFRCVLPNTGFIPTHVSLSDRTCKLQPNMLEVVVPDEPENGQVKDVSACVKCLFGNFTESMAPFLVSWLESMRLFGMPEIYVDEDILYMAPVIKRIFSYYKEAKFLHMRKFENNLYQTDIPNVDDPLSQSILMPVSNDCFYRNMNKYKYILHIDFDELMVPRRHTTYAEAINEFLQINPQYFNSSCLEARSAPFYTYLNKGNLKAPNYAPILQYSYRMPPIIPGQDGISAESSGVRKAFVNTQTCSMLFIHGCHSWVPGFMADPKPYMPVYDMLVHHYRMTCKANNQNTGVCPPSDYHEINDTLLWDKFGSVLSDNIKQVLLKVGYL